MVLLEKTRFYEKSEAMVGLTSREKKCPRP